MKRSKRRFVALGFSFISLITVACTPPIPPDVLASFAESEVQCGNGEVKVASSEVAAVAIQASIDLYLTYCPESKVTSVLEVDGANLIVTDNSKADPLMCEDVSVQTPVVSKTSTLAYFISGYDGLVFSPEAVQGIISGEITNLNDPKITSTNENFEFSDTPLTLFGVKDPSSSDVAYLSWVSRLTGSEVSVIKAVEQFDNYSSLLEKFTVTEGAIAVLPSNIIFDNTLTYSNLRTGEIDTLFETTSFAAAASQIVGEAQGDILKVKLDPTVESKLDAGQDTSSAPWQGISTFDVGMCSADDAELSVRKFMRFLLRLDTQGQLEIYGYFPLSEEIRLQAAGIVGKVLPTPSFDPEQLSGN